MTTRTTIFFTIKTTIDGGKHECEYSWGSGGTSFDWSLETPPFSDGKTTLKVSARSNAGYEASEDSDLLTVNYAPICDKSLSMPEEVRFQDGYLRWDAVDGGYRYWIRIFRDGKYVQNNDYTYINLNWVHNAIYPHLWENQVYIGERLPEEGYEIELFVVSENGTYNSKIYPIEINTVHDETIWTPELYYKFGSLCWDFDEIRHPETDCFWSRIRNGADNSVVSLKFENRGFPGMHYYSLLDLPESEYIVDVCVGTKERKLGPWSEPIMINKHGEGLFDKENETTTDIEPLPEAADIPEADRITSLTINPAFNMKHKDGSDVELDLTKIKVKANEIYDEAGLKRLEEALGTKISPNRHYNLLDMTLLYDGSDFSNGYDGLVEVRIPIPTGHRDKSFKCYRLVEVNGEMTKEIIPGEQTEDCYIIYLEHFSEYALIGSEPEDAHTLVKHEAVPAACTDKGIGEYWECSGCGMIFGDKDGTVELDKPPAAAALGHSWNDGEVTTPPTETSEGVKTFTCTVCGETKTESIPKLQVGNPSGDPGNDPNGDPGGDPSDNPSGGTARPDEPTTTETPSEPTTTETPSEPTTTETPSEPTTNETPNEPDNSSSDSGSGADGTGLQNSGNTPDRSENGNPDTGTAFSILPVAVCAAVLTVSIKRRK